MVFNPGKKNRNFGTKKRGRGQDNRHVIPESFFRDWKSYYEKLGDYRAFDLPTLHGSLRFLVEVPREDFYHAVTPEDVVHLISALSKEHTSDLEIVVFRQPTRRQLLLSPVWGRLVYFTEIDEHEGLAIYLEAVPHPNTWTNSKSVGPDAAKEYARLEALGVDVRYEKRAIRISPSPAATRNVQLYHSIPHELGHLDDDRRHRRFSLDDAEEAALESERRIDEGTPHYEQKTAAEREVYAHRFSDERRAELREAGRIPFERRFDEARMAEFGVEAAWFLPPD